MFAIRVLPESRVGVEGKRLGEIVIGDFRETFPCYPGDQSLEQMESRWHQELQRPVQGGEFAILRHDQRFAWAIYRRGETCYVQQVLSVDGLFSQHAVRRRTTEDANVISEWETSVHDIMQFVRA